MSRLVAIVAVAGAIVGSLVGSNVGATPAVADPADHVPYCSGDQTPMDSNCRIAPTQVFTHDGNPGANPEVPLGTGSGEALPT